MYFSFIIFVILLIIITIMITNYKNKAVKSGEANLSLMEKNILPFCTTCKYSSLVSFILIIASGVILVLAPGSSENGQWSLFNLSLKNWTVFHCTVITVFILSFAFHTYIHWGWVKSMVEGRLKAAGKIF